MKTQCEFCSEIKECESSSIVGFYCIDCHETVISESQKAIETIRNNISREITE